MPEKAERQKRNSCAKKSSTLQVEKLLYRREEAAFALGLSTRSIDIMISDQRLTTRKFGRCVMIPAADVRRVAEEIIKSDMVKGA